MGEISRRTRYSVTPEISARMNSAAAEDKGAAHSSGMFERVRLRMEPVGGEKGRQENDARIETKEVAI